jgi:hypothetical protein
MDQALSLLALAITRPVLPVLSGEVPQKTPAL